MIKSGKYSISKYGFVNVLRTQQRVTNFNYNIVYKNKIYFVNSKKEIEYLRSNLNLLNNSLILNKKHPKVRIFSLYKIFDD